MPEQREDWMPLHKQYFINTGRPLGVSYVKKGQIITFIYNGERRWVLVVDPEWEQKLHGLDLKHFPRHLVLRLLNGAPPSLTAKQFYEQHVNRPWIKETHAYRTYDRTKLGNIEEITYNLSVQAEEKDEPGTDTDTPDTPSLTREGDIKFP